jgi:uncharacterized protein with HEPN domain
MSRDYRLYLADIREACKRVIRYTQTDDIDAIPRDEYL